MAEHPVLVTGATGTVGAAAVAGLLRAGVPVRAAARDTHRVQAMFGDRVEAVTLDFTDPGTWSAAFAGVRQMFLLRPPQLGTPRTQMLPALVYARGAGMRQVVFLSLQGAEHNKVVPHATIEAWLLVSGLDWTFVRASFFMQNLTTTHVSDIRDRNQIVVPAGRGATAFVDAVDVGDVAAAALIDPDRHRNKAWTPTGPQALTYQQIARTLTDVLGRPIRFARPGAVRYAFHAHRLLGMPWPMVAVTTAIYTIARLGHAAGLTTDVQTVLGRPPTPFEVFAVREKNAWNPPSPSVPSTAHLSAAGLGHDWRRSLSVTRSAVERLLLIPRVGWLARRAPKDTQTGWNRYWAKVVSTGIDGGVLGDTGDLDETTRYQTLMRQHLDTSLPLIDIGCGNGRFTRRLAALFPTTMGVDLSPHATARATSESAGQPNLTFHSLDATVPGALDRIGADAGPVNVFIRGVFPVLTPAQRTTLARNVLPLLGATGRLFLTETNYRSSHLGYLKHLGATPGRIPEPLEQAIRTATLPGHFGRTERQAAFPAADWTVIDDGDTDIETIPMHSRTVPEHIPGYYAILEARFHDHNPEHAGNHVGRIRSQAEPNRRGIEDQCR